MDKRRHDMRGVALLAGLAFLMGARPAWPDACCTEEDQTNCQDGLWCTGEETCNCWGDCDPGVPRNCDDGNWCTVDRCVDSAPVAAGTGVGVGYCEHRNICDPCEVDADCDDADECTEDICISTVCYNNSITCDDTNICTDDTCDPATGCVFTWIAGCCNTSADCDDGLWCNGDETCTFSTHSCNAGTARCTGRCETCDEATDSCGATWGGPCTVAGDCCGDPGDCMFWTCASGTCRADPVVCDDRLSCTTDACDPVDDSCSSTLDVGWCLIAGVCYMAGALNPANSCQECDPVVSTTMWSPVAAPSNDTCASSITIPVGGSADGDTFCASPDYVDGGPCGSGATSNDLVYDFGFTTGTDYQLYHYRVSEVGSGATRHPDPYVYTRSTCTDGTLPSEFRCNDDCWNGFFGTNYSTGCGADPALSGVVVVNPVPIGFSKSAYVIADGEAATRGTITTSVTRESHSNNSCIGVPAYHAAPMFFPGDPPSTPQDVRWRGNNVGYGDVASIAPTCRPTATREAAWFIATTGLPRIHFWYDELALLYDGDGSTNPFDGVLTFLGPDGSIDNCSDAVGAGCVYRSGWRPASIVLGNRGVDRTYWLVLGSAAGEGQYELRAMAARARFRGLHEWFEPLWPASSGGANFDLECTRLDFTPDGSATEGYMVMWSATGCGWAVDPSGAPGRVVWQTLTLPGNMDDCAVNYPIGFRFLWGNQFYSRMIVDTNGRIQLVYDATLCAAECNWTCADSGASASDLYTVDNPMIAPFWADLVACEQWTSGACAGRRGRITRQIAPVAAPTGEVITATVVSWEDFGYWAGWGGDVDFQVILYIDGRFSIVYRHITGDSSEAWWTNRGLVGISGQVGATGSTVNFR